VRSLPLPVVNLDGGLVFGFAQIGLVEPMTLRLRWAAEAQRSRQEIRRRQPSLERVVIDVGEAAGRGAELHADVLRFTIEPLRRSGGGDPKAGPIFAKRAFALMWDWDEPRAR
jgi:hypothetical protein